MIEIWFNSGVEIRKPLSLSFPFLSQGFLCPLSASRSHFLAPTVFSFQTNLLDRNLKKIWEYPRKYTLLSLLLNSNRLKQGKLFQKTEITTLSMQLDPVHWHIIIRFGKFLLEKRHRFILLRCPFVFRKWETLVRTGGFLFFSGLGKKPLGFF